MNEAMDDILEHYDIFGLPAMLVFGRDGKVHKFEDAFSFTDDVLPAIEKLALEP